MLRLAPLAPMVLILVAACTSGGAPPGRGGGMRGEGPGGPVGGGAGGGFAMAARLVDRGEYEAALAGLRCIASQGAGFEIAQYLAGYSALRLAEAGDTPEILRAELRVEGFDRLIDAAEAGWPAAQAVLAEEFAATPGADTLFEAAYWAEVYRRNAREGVYGIDRLDDAVEADIVARLDPDRLAVAEARAGGFAISPLQSAEPGPQCGPWLRSGRGGSTGGPGGRLPPPGGGGRRPPPAAAAYEACCSSAAASSSVPVSSGRPWQHASTR